MELSLAHDAPAMPTRFAAPHFVPKATLMGRIEKASTAFVPVLALRSPVTASRHAGGDSIAGYRIHLA
jgi:hypothetical protein